MRYSSTSVIVFAVLSLLPCCDVYGQVAPGAGLPKGWNGSWKGACTTTYADGRKLEYAMGLRIDPIEGRKASSWIITYESSEMNQTRSYEILAVDAEAGHFRIDEKNSIVLDTFLIGDTLHSRFEIEGQNLESTYRLMGATIEVTMISSSGEPKTKSGGEDGISEVASFEHLSVQRGVLTRTGEDE